MTSLAFVFPVGAGAIGLVSGVTAAIARMGGRLLRMPSTARYQFIAELSKGTNWARRREDVVWCYNVSVEINPDRSWNGYTLWTLFIRDGKIIKECKT